ncbi:hypothetical protein V2J09_020882 [Rumex salicifolius]
MFPKELQRIEENIETINYLFQYTDKIHFEEFSLKKCFSRFRKVLYDIDYFVDALVAKALHMKTMSSRSFTKEVQFFSKSNQLGIIFKIAHKVKSLKESLDHIRVDIDMCVFCIVQQPPVVKQVLRFDEVETHSFVHQNTVIERDQEIDRIISMLLVEGEGLGKTTLAQLVYNDDKVKQGFDVFHWTCVNYLSNSWQVLIEIIALKEKRHHDLSLENLQRLEAIISCSKSGTKVLVITWSKDDVECLNTPNTCCVNLELLSDRMLGGVSEYPELVPLRKKLPDVALTSIAKSALQLFTSLAKDGLLILWKPLLELQRLKDTIETIDELPLDANLCKVLRKFLYEADDYFDALATKALRIRLCLVVQSRMRYDFSSPTQTKFDRERTHFFVLQEDVIGRDQTGDHIISMILLEAEGEGKKFLVVLDDVGDETSINWLKLETIFNYGKSSSKLLHMMTLMLKGCTKLEQFPSKIENLISLRNSLYVDVRP